MILVILLSLAALPRPVLAGFTVADKGTTGAQFLAMGVGARAAAMGEAFTAVADDATALYWNPAGLGQLNRPELAAVHQQIFAALQHDFLAYVHPVHRRLVLGAGLTSLVQDGLESLDNTGSARGRFAPWGFAAAFGLSFTPAPGWHIGAAPKYVRLSAADGVEASLAAVDVGLLKRWGGLSAGVSASHLGPHLRFSREGDPLPAVVRLGLAYRLDASHLMDQEDSMILSLEASAPRGNQPRLHFGVEYSVPVRAALIIALRGGFRTANAGDLNTLTAFSIGAGFGSRSVSVDIAVVPFGQLGVSYRAGMGVKFGPAPPS